MRRRDFTEEDAIRGTTSNPSQSSRREPILIRRLVTDALQALWSFYDRSLDDGVRWEVADVSNGLAIFAVSMTSSPGRLIDACRDLQGHRALTDDEAATLRAVVAVADALMLPGGNSSRRKCADDAEHRSAFAYFGRQDRGGDADMGTDGRRSDDRRDVVLLTDFRHEATQYRVEVRNLSSGGAMIVGASRPPIGTRASVYLEGLGWIDGSIAWAIESRCGFSFDAEIDPDDLFGA